MKKTTTTAAATIIAAGLAFGIGLPAQAAETQECRVVTVIVEPAYVDLVQHEAKFGVETKSIKIETAWGTTPPEGDGWEATGEKRWIKTADAIPGTPAVGEPTMEIDNPDYVAPQYTPGYWKDVPAVYIPAQGEPKITVANPDYQPAVPPTEAVYGEPPLISAEVPAQEAVYETLYKFVHKWDVLHLNPKWKADPNWNAEGNPNSHGWHFTGDTKQGKLISPAVPYQPAVYGEPPLITPAHPGSPEVGTPTIEIDNPDYVPASYTPATKEWVKPVYVPGNGEPKTITVDNPDYVPATDGIDEQGYHEDEYERTLVIWVGEGEEPQEGYELTDKTRPVLLEDAWVEEVEVPAVTEEQKVCDEVPPVKEEPATPAAAKADTLPVTGSDSTLLLAGGAGLLALGAGALGLRRARR